MMVLVGFFAHNPQFFLDIGMLTGIGAYFSVIYAAYAMLIVFFEITVYIDS